MLNLLGCQIAGETAGCGIEEIRGMNEIEAGATICRGS
jgi:hypothetical protein